MYTYIAPNNILKVKQHFEVHSEEWLLLHDATEEEEPTKSEEERKTDCWTVPYLHVGTG